MRVVVFGPDDAIPICECCERKAFLYVDNDDTSPILAYCKRHATQLFTKLGKKLGFVD